MPASTGLPSSLSTEVVSTTKDPECALPLSRRYAAESINFFNAIPTKVMLAVVGEMENKSLTLFDRALVEESSLSVPVFKIMVKKGTFNALFWCGVLLAILMASLGIMFFLARTKRQGPYFFQDLSSSNRRLASAIGGTAICICFVCLLFCVIFVFMNMLKVGAAIESEKKFEQDMINTIEAHRRCMPFFMQDALKKPIRRAETVLDLRLISETIYAFDLSSGIHSLFKEFGMYGIENYLNKKNRATKEMVKRLQELRNCRADVENIAAKMERIVSEASATYPNRKHKNFQSLLNSTLLYVKEVVGNLTHQLSRLLTQRREISITEVHPYLKLLSIVAVACSTVVCCICISATVLLYTRHFYSTESFMFRISACVCLLAGFLLFLSYSFGIIIGCYAMTSVKGVYRTWTSSNHSYARDIIKYLDDCKQGKVFAMAAGINRQGLMKACTSEGMHGVMEKEQLEKCIEMYVPKIIEVKNRTLELIRFAREKKSELANLQRSIDHVEKALEMLSTDTKVIAQRTNDLVALRCSEDILDSLNMRTRLCHDSHMDDLFNKKVVHRHIVAPVQGQWFACILAALASCLVFLMLFAEEDYFKASISGSTKTRPLAEKSHDKPKKSTEATKQPTVDVNKTTDKQPSSEKTAPEGSKFESLKTHGASAEDVAPARGSTEAAASHGSTESAALPKKSAEKNDA